VLEVGIVRGVLVLAVASGAAGAADAVGLSSLLGFFAAAAAAKRVDLRFVDAAAPTLVIIPLFMC
jgi:hypothetical protein